MKLKDLKNFPSITIEEYQKRLLTAQAKCFDIPLLPAPSNADYFMAVYNEHKANDKVEKLPKVMKVRTFTDNKKAPRKIIDYNKPFKYKGAEPRVYEKPVSKNAKTHYAIIDHVGSLEENDMKRIYKKVFSQTAENGYEKDKTCFTMKNFCKRQYNRYTRKPLTDARLKSMKFAMRNQKNPEQVYFICPQLYKSTEREVRKWAERGIKVHIYEVNSNIEWNLPYIEPLTPPAEYYITTDPVEKQKLFDPSANIKKTPVKTTHAPADYIYEHFMMSASTDASYEDFEATHKYAWDSTADTIRRLVDMLAPAFGIMLSAPAIHFDKDRVPDNYIKRPDFEARVNSGETHYTKPFTSSTKFLTTYRCVATDEEIKETWYKIAYILHKCDCTVEMHKSANFGSITGDIVKLKEYLDIDYMICEECGRPMRITNHKDEYQHTTGYVICPHCNAKYEEEIAFSVFYDDAYFEDCEYYSLDQAEDTEYTEDQYWKDLEAEYDF